GGHISAEMIAGSPKLQIVARHGAGYDNVDFQAAAEYGVWVTNTPGANRRSVVEHVFALLLSLGRKLQMASDQTRNSVWAEDRLSLTGIELEGRTIGLIGFGDIGQHVAPVAEAFGMKTNESLLRVGMSAVEAIAAVLRGEAPQHPVNKPVAKSFH
nr:D-3-phosphoglycerate dehydrogenase 2, chloroplastic [Tanacetum cinerariifolium]